MKIPFRSRMSYTAPVAGTLFLLQALASTASTAAEVTITGNVSPAPADTPTWNVEGNLVVGYEGTGTLNVEAGGVVSSRYGYLGDDVASSGTAIVSGEGSQWNNSNSLAVGFYGTGMLNVEDGGVVSNVNSYLGRIAGSTGTVVVTGGDSQWNSSSYLAVGFDGSGMLNVEAGGMVSNTDGHVGLGASSSGTATVTGEGAQWNNSTYLAVGDRGTGTLNVADGGVVSNQNGYVGRETGSTGTVTVAGAGSQWNNTDDLHVGYEGAGTLNVDGGVVSSPHVIVAYTDSSTGIINLNGGTLTTGQVSEGSGTGGGTITFDGGTLQLSGDQGDLFSGFKAGDVTLVAGGGTLDTQAFEIASGANLSGEGRLTKEGTGSLTLSGDNTHTGGTSVNMGSLYVEGSLANGAVTVASGTLLGGSGSIAGDVTVQDGGTLAPGSSPGLLTVGALNLEAGAITAMEINGSMPGTGHDQVVVNGTANLDGDLNLSFGGSEPVNGQSFTLIDAAAINGDFETLNVLFDKEMVFDVEITDDYIFKIIGIETDFASVAGLDPELLQIATLIDDHFADLGLIPIINELNLLPSAELPLAFQQISPQELTVLENFTFANARLVSTRLKSRQRSVRNGASGFSTAGFHLYDETGQQIRNSLVADAGAGIPEGAETQPLPLDTKLSTYISGSGTTRDFDGDNSGPGYEDDSFAILLGVDSRLNDTLAIGAYLGYNHTDADLHEDGGNADLDTYRLGFTGTYWNALTETTGYFTTAYIGFAQNEYDTHRNGFGGKAKGDTDAFEFDLGTSIGYEVNFDRLLLTTELSLDYVNLEMDGFTEKGSNAPLKISDDSSESLSSTLSLRLDYSTEYRGIELLPYAHAGWRHEYMDDSNSVAARFAASPGVGGFTVDGASVARDSLVGGLGLGAELQDGLIVQLGYYAEYSSDFESNSVLGSVSLQF